VLFGYPNDESAAGNLGLVPAHLLQSHSLKCMRACSAVALLSVSTVSETNISQHSVAMHLRHFLLTVSAKEF